MLKKIYDKREFIFPYLFNKSYLIKEKVKSNFSLNNEEINSLSALKGKHSGERCFIVGNGPSLTIEDLEALNNEVTFCANKIYLAFENSEFRPTYYLVEDNLVAFNDGNIISKLHWPNTTYFFPKDLRYWLKPLKGRNEYYLNMLRKYDSFPQFTDDLSKQIYWGSTVTYSSIQLAYYFGFSEINLIGVDFSFSFNNEKTEKDENFLKSEGEVNHFHKDYRKEGELWNKPKLELQLESFRKAKIFLEENGIKIFNATRGGKLEVFERKNLDELIVESKNKL